MTSGQPRLLWLNGPHYIGKHTLAAFLRDGWGFPVLDADAVSFTLGRGMPAALVPRDLQSFDLGLWAMFRLGVEMARAFGTVVMPAALHHPAAVAEVVGQFRRAEVDVLHVALRADDATLTSRIHAHSVDQESKRRALADMRRAAAGLNAVRGGVRLDTTRRTPHQLMDDLAEAVVGHGWQLPPAVPHGPVPPAG